jgi:hypothetical protein
VDEAGTGKDVSVATLKAGSEMVYLERLTSVAEAYFFNSNTTGINACSTHLRDTATLELLYRRGLARLHALVKNSWNA